MNMSATAQTVLSFGIGITSDLATPIRQALKVAGGKVYGEVLKVPADKLSLADDYFEAYCRRDRPGPPDVYSSLDPNSDVPLIQQALENAGVECLEGMFFVPLDIMESIGCTLAAFYYQHYKVDII